jgi:hypothetical protein
VTSRLGDLLVEARGGGADVSGREEAAVEAEYGYTGAGGQLVSVTEGVSADRATGDDGASS